MNLVQFTLGMILVVSAAYLSVNVNWREELQDLSDLLFKAKKKMRS